MKKASGNFSALSGRLVAATALACIMAAALVPAARLHAQAINTNVTISDDARMLLEAETLEYDFDREVIAAVGGVQIDYDGHRLVANRVEYNQKSGRLTATGNVEIVQSDGTRLLADEIDITDDFSDGFVNALRVETIDRTFFEAESSERQDGQQTTFNNGVYTACEPCRENPDKSPSWQFKARKIIRDQKEKTIRLEAATFELFGLPIAYLPVLQLPDTKRRQTGFLQPEFKYQSDLGYGVTIPYYFALSPSYDLTVSGTLYSKQGFLGEAEWRQRLDNGAYNVRIAGISQARPEEFGTTEVDSTFRERGLIATQGAFAINPRWTFGWNVLFQSDKDFAYTYDIDGYDNYSQRSEIYLTGLHERNYFDLRAMRFDVQESIPDSNPVAMNPRQPWVLPSLDYSYTPDTPIAGGELNFDVNGQFLYRDVADGGPDLPVHGVAGKNARITAGVEWKRTFITDSGLVFTPLLQARGDANYLDATAVNSAYAITESQAYRAMVTAGLEVRWPLLISTASSTHVIEPTAQLFVRPDEKLAGTLPNEDAQSLVFDATALFRRDKFSGYDRLEGGTRANVGIRYSGQFDNGWLANGIFGQSYHLFGQNSYASPDLVYVGASSGLETDVSDFVGMIGMASPTVLADDGSITSLAFSATGRFDEKSFDTRRIALNAGATLGDNSVSASYTFIGSQPLYGYESNRQELTVSASSRLAGSWRAFGSGTVDFETSTLVANTIGVSYADDCFAYSFILNQTRTIPTSTTPTSTSTTIGLAISLRTIGEVAWAGAGSDPFIRR